MTFADQAERAGRELVAQASARPRKPRDRYRQQVFGRFEMATKATKATIWIDRAGTVNVRPYRKHRVYRLPIETIAQMLVREQIRAEARVKKSTPHRRRAR